jgi:hypothetical protein
MELVGFGWWVWWVVGWVERSRIAREHGENSDMKEDAKEA